MKEFYVNSRKGVVFSFDSLNVIDTLPDLVIRDTVKKFNYKWLYNVLWVSLIYSIIFFGFYLTYKYSNEFNFILFTFPAIMGVRLSMLFLFDPIECFWKYKYVKNNNNEKNN